MSIRNNQSGMGAIEVLLIIVVVCILGFTGWFVWQNQHKVTQVDLANWNMQLKVKSSHQLGAEYVTSPMDGDNNASSYTIYTAKPLKGCTDDTSKTLLATIERHTATAIVGSDNALPGEQVGKTWEIALKDVGNNDATVIGKYVYAFTPARSCADVSTEMGKAANASQSNVTDKVRQAFRELKSSGEASSQQTTQSKASNSAETNQTFLSITEWGVKLPLTEKSIVHANYIVDSKYQSNVETIGLSTKEVQEEPSLKQVRTTLYRSTSPQALIDAGVQYPKTSFVKIGQYYYVYQPTTGYGGMIELTPAQQSLLDSTFAHGEGFDLVWEKIESVK